MIISTCLKDKLVMFFVINVAGSGSAGEGEPPGGEVADTTLTLTVKVLRRILKDDLSAFTAYMTGQMTIEGDIQGATDLAKLVDLIK